jgi:hypothetical protein
VQVVKDNITRVMSTAHDFRNELGGKKKDQEVIDLCNDLIDKADGAKRCYQQAPAFVLRLNARLAVVLSTVLAVVSIVCPSGEDLRICPSFSDDTSIRNFSLVALPIFAAALLSTESTFRPRAKYATLLLAQHKLESEKYKFRARVGAYNSFDRSKSRKNNVRKRFMEECKAVFEECSKSEFKDGGVLETKWHVLTLIRESFRCACFSRTLRKIKRTKPKIELDYSTGKVTILNPMRRLYSHIANGCYHLSCGDKNEVYVPIVLAISAAADAFLVFFQLESVTPVLHVAYSELRSINILLETTGLTTLETRLLLKKTMFVQHTEAAILSYYKHMANATLRLERSNQDEDALEDQRRKLEKSFSKRL